MGTFQHASNLFNAAQATAAALGATSGDPMDLVPALGSENVPPTAREPLRSSRNSQAVVPKLDPNPLWSHHLDVWLEDKSMETRRKYNRAIRTLRAFVNDVSPESVTLQQLAYRGHDLAVHMQLQQRRRRPPRRQVRRRHRQHRTGERRREVRLCAHALAPAGDALGRLRRALEQRDALGEGRRRSRSAVS